MNNKQKAEAVLCEYTSIQEALCRALKEGFTARGFENLPSRGAVSVDNDYWEFRKHGAGVCFNRVPDGHVVDVHVEPIAEPRGVDAWRLLQYLESIGINSLIYKGVGYEAEKEASLDELLKQLLADGFLIAVNQQRRIYAIDKVNRAGPT